MFEVGFSELLMVGLVALLVLGPEKLPKAARMAGFWLGKARHTLSTINAEIRQELYIEEMRQLAKQNQIHDELQQTIKETENSLDEINADLKILSDKENQSIDDRAA
jgi:sec-independent protein translocase protein TatB